MTNVQKANLESQKRKMESAKFELNKSLKELPRSERTRRIQVVITNIETSLLWLDHALAYQNK